MGWRPACWPIGTSEVLRQGLNPNLAPIPGNQRNVAGTISRGKHSRAVPSSWRLGKTLKMGFERQPQSALLIPTVYISLAGHLDNKDHVCQEQKTMTRIESPLRLSSPPSSDPHMVPVTYCGTLCIYVLANHDPFFPIPVDSERMRFIQRLYVKSLCRRGVEYEETHCKCLPTLHHRASRFLVICIDTSRLCNGEHHFRSGRSDSVQRDI